MKKINSKYFFFLVVVGWGSFKEKVHLFFFPFSFIPKEDVCVCVCVYVCVNQTS